MNTQTVCMLFVSSIAVVCAVLFGVLWYTPLLRGLSQRPIEHLLKRAGCIGFDEQQLRTRLFLLEAAALGGLTWATWNHLGIVLGLTVFAVGYHLRALALEWVVHSRERLLRSQTLSITSALQGLVQGGMGLAPAVELLARQTPAPLGLEIRRIAIEFKHGRPLMDAVGDVREKLQLDAFSLLVTSIICALKQGSALNASLAGVQEALEHRDYAERQMRSKTSAARSTIIILACTPPGFFILFGLMMPGSMTQMFTSMYGHWMLAGILGLLYVGVAWARKLTTLH
jgi:tight adherence protein B